MDTIGKRLRSTRTKKNMSMKQLENLSGISSGNISDIENDKKIPGGKAIIELCNALNMTADWFLTGNEKLVFFTDEEKELIKKYRLLTERERGRIEEIIESSEGNKIKYDKIGNLL